MVAIVSVETVLLVLLLVLVAGLLRSNAEILRRLGPPGSDGAPAAGDGASALEDGTPAAGDGASAFEDGASAVSAAPPRVPGASAVSAAPPRVPGASPVSAAPPRVPGAPAPAVAGPTPTGDAITLDFSAAGSPTLLAFLTTGCTTCAGFWTSLAERRVAPGVKTVVVAHGPERERLRRLRELAAPGVPVIMSSQAWQDYAVPGSPYFVLVDGAIRGEGVATSWEALSSLVGDAIEDAGQAGGGDNGNRGTARALRVDRTLAGAGIGPDHPSLYPTKPAEGE
jgi:hypothetical protein